MEITSSYKMQADAFQVPQYPYPVASPAAQIRCPDPMALSASKIPCFPLELFEMIIRYLNPSETVCLLLTCRRFLPVLNSDSLWETLHKTQRVIHQYLDDHFSHLIQHVAQDRTQQMLHRRLCSLFTRGCVPWKVKQKTWFPLNERFRHVKILPNGNLAMSDDSLRMSIWTPQLKLIATPGIRCIFYPPKKDNDMAFLANGGFIALAEGETFRRGAVYKFSAMGHRLREFPVHYIACLVGLLDGNIAIGKHLPDYSYLAEEDRVFVYSPGFAYITSAELTNCSITRIAALPNERFITSCKEGEIYERGDEFLIIWSYHGGELVRDAILARQHMDRSITGMAVLPHGNIVVGYEDGAIIWSPDGIRLSECAAENIEGHDHYVSKIVVLTSGNFATLHFHTVCIWSPDGHLLGTTRCHTDRISAIAALPDGGFITASLDNTTKIWSPSGIQTATLNGHGQPVNCVAALPNGNVLTVSTDGQAKIWTMDIESIMQTRNSEGNGCFSGCSVS